MTYTSDTICVLYVDAEPDPTARRLEHERERFAVATAASAAEALAHLEAEQVDCVVSDYELPDRDGVSLLESVRERAPELPFVLHPAGGSEAVASDAIAAGVTDYLPRGEDGREIPELADRITDAVGKYRASQSADATEEKLHQLAAETDDVLFMFDADWEELLFVNDAYEAVWGEPVDALAADPRSFLASVHAEDRERVRRSMATTTRGETAEVQFRVQHDDGDQRWVRARSKPVFDDDGAVDRVAGFVRDVTDQRTRERELERYKRQYEAVFQDPNILVAVLEPDGTVREVNNTAMEYVDSGLDAVVGERFWATPWWVDEGHSDVEAWVDRAAGGEYVEFETEIMGTGGRRTVQGVFRPVGTTDGDAESIIVSARDISARKERERELERLWDRVEFALAATDSAIWEWDLGADTFERHGVGRLVGLDSFAGEDAFSLEEFLDRVHEDDRSLVAESFDRLQRDRLSHRIEFRVNPGDGEGVRWLEDHTSVRGDEAEAVGLLTDVTERKQRERAIQGLYDVTHDIWSSDTPDAVAGVVVEAARDILDMSINGVHLYDEDRDCLRPVASTDCADELIGEIPAFDRGEGLAWEVFETGEPRQFDDVSTASGRFNPETNVRSELILPLSGHGVLHVGSPETAAFDETDVSMMQTLLAHATGALDQIERERRLAELQARTQRLMHTETKEATANAAVQAAHDILNSPSSGVHLCTDDGEALEPVAVVDTIREEFDLPTYHRDAEDDPVADVVWEAFDAGEPIVLDDVRERKDLARASPARSAIVYPVGEYGVFIVSSTQPNAFDAADKTFVELVATSLTTALDRVERESNLQARERALERQNERLEQFARIVSHDLRNPLNVAQGRLELVRDEVDSEHLDAIGRAHDRMDTLISDLLTLAREGDAATETTAVDVADVATDCWRTVDTGTATLATVGNRTVRADEGLLRQLFENLIRNSVEHGPAGSRAESDGCIEHGTSRLEVDEGGETGDGTEASVTVTVGDLPDGFYVADDGPGIPESEREAVFDAGYSTSDGGTGFGLSIVRQVAEAHDWAVQVTESEDGGARFEITGVDGA